MKSSTDIDFIASLNYNQEQLNRFLSSTIFIFGAVGNILNCVLLSERKFRANPCALLFLVSSFVDLISILVGLPTRILAGWQLDPTTTITWLCRCRAFLVFSTRTMATWLIVFATVDRWLLSSTDIHRRQLSSIKHTKIQIIISFILSILSYGHMLSCYEANIVDQPLKCYGNTNACRLVTDLMYASVTIVIPLIIMIIFGLMTISNVRHVHMRVQQGINIPDNHAYMEQKNHHGRKVNHHLLRMLFVQVVFLIILCVPQAIQKIYITVRPFGSGSEAEDAMKTFLYNIELLLAFIASGMPFYIYTLSSGTMYRTALIDLTHAIHRKLTCL
ncbi:hypothetical protein I4U23_020231 [Adineta vaga]|nr:hypothetical protein I4U23_020231 [Adineta vaga]